MSSTPSLSQKDNSSTTPSKTPSTSSTSSSASTSTLSKLKKHLAAVKQTWGPLLPAKEHWDDEYNFPAGRWAGQGLDYDTRYQWAVEVSHPRRS
ncbi:hypothetical protein BJX70DRAFT_381711 [Aspergillus crustosus]